jgi:hypothetical protein
MSYAVADTFAHTVYYPDAHGLGYPNGNAYSDCDSYFDP